MDEKAWTLPPELEEQAIFARNTETETPAETKDPEQALMEAVQDLIISEK